MTQILSGVTRGPRKHNNESHAYNLTYIEQPLLPPKKIGIIILNPQPRSCVEIWNYLLPEAKSLHLESTPSLALGSANSRARSRSTSSLTETCCAGLLTIPNREKLTIQVTCLTATLRIPLALYILNWFRWTHV